jgi:hydrogenase maturation protein HypF
MLALGGQMKACLAFGLGHEVVISEELGELDSPLGLARLEATAASLQSANGLKAQSLICDAHPGYTSTRWARSQRGMRVRRVFHHHAHAAAVAGEFPEEARWLCFTWDGVGLGPDGTLWGGEALLGAPAQWQRVATFRPFTPCGGEQAARAPWRSAASLAWALGLDFPPPEQDVALAKVAWQKNLNCPPTSAVGRLFDAAASFLNLVHDATFEAEGPIAVQAAASASTGMVDAVCLPLNARDDGTLVADWAPLVSMLCDRARPQSERAAVFHASLALSLAVQAIAIRKVHGDFAVGLSGGVFQNRLLTHLAQDILAQAGFRVYLPEQHPCHDGGLSFGQIVEHAASA